MHKLGKYNRLSRYFFAALIIPLLSALTVSMTTAVAPISQSYLTSKPIPVGSLVSMMDGATDQVEGAASSNAKNLIGVTVNEGAPITITTGALDQTLVATNGVVPALVSDINGVIENGDQITASPIVGVGMKATSNAKIVGVAQSTMTGSGKQTIKDERGEDQEVNIGQISLLVSVGYHYQQPDKTLIPPAFQNIANSVAGKKVDPLPILISLAIFIITMVVVVSIIYSIIRNSIISIGRNPMAQSAVYRSIIQLSAIVFALIGGGVLAIYFVLTKM